MTILADLSEPEAAPATDAADA
jgi:hypothetical protein